MEHKKQLISIENLTVKYDEVTALHDVSLTVYAGDFLGVIGPNGGGKTTLIKAMLGLVKPSEGRVVYYDSEGKQTNKIKIGYLPQYASFDFSFPITVEEVIKSGLLGGKSLFYRFGKQDKEQSQRVMQMLQIDHLANRPIGELSGGQRQRVLMGRALVGEPQLLILDEPSTYIDKDSENQMYDLLRKINSQCGIVLVSHDVGTVVQTVRNIACVNTTLHYHPSDESLDDWFEDEVGCPFELVAHGHVPHRILCSHPHHHPKQ